MEFLLNTLSLTVALAERVSKAGEKTIYSNNIYAATVSLLRTD